MRVLVVSQYFPPEVGATQNRLNSFVEGLLERGHSVTVLCEQPNHPAGVFQPGFGKRPVMSERREDGRLVVHRLWVAASPAKTTARRLAFYGTFAAGAWMGVSMLRRHDVVFATSPPLPGALGAAAAAAMRRRPFVLDVRDLWPAAAEALGELSRPRIIRALTHAERWLYRRAATVTATTRPFCVHIDRVVGDARAVHLPNGALDSLVIRPTVVRPDDGPFVVGYVGNLGIAQGLGIVLEAARALRNENVRFLVVGDGPLAGWLRTECERDGLAAIEIRRPVAVADVGPVLESCDALLVPLGASPMLEDFIPSKLYDAMAVGRPAIVAARGESARLVEEAGGGVVVPPEDGVALSEAIRSLERDRARARAMGVAGRKAAAEMTRSRQVDKLEGVLAAACGGGR